MIPLLAISQDGYPKLTKINNDTFVLFTESQAKQLDAYRIEFDREVAFKKFYESRLQECNTLLFKYQEQDKDQKSVIADYEKLGSVNDNIIKGLTDMNSILKDDKVELEEKLNLSSTLTKIFGGAFLIAMGFLLIH